MGGVAAGERDGAGRNGGLSKQSQDGGNIIVHTKKYKDGISYLNAFHQGSVTRANYAMDGTTCPSSALHVQ